MTQDVAAARVRLKAVEKTLTKKGVGYSNADRAYDAVIDGGGPKQVASDLRSILARVAALEEGMPTEAMLSAARGLIMARDLGAPNHVTTLGDVARSGYYGSEWAHILTDEERAMTGPLTKAHFAQLIWRAMSSARDRDFFADLANKSDSQKGGVA